MAQDKSIRVNLTFKKNVLDLIDGYAKEYGLSRSGMLSVLVMNKREQDTAAKLISEAKQLANLN